MAVWTGASAHVIRERPRQVDKGLRRRIRRRRIVRGRADRWDRGDQVAVPVGGPNSSATMCFGIAPLRR